MTKWTNPHASGPLVNAKTGFAIRWGAPRGCYPPRSGQSTSLPALTAPFPMASAAPYRRSMGLFRANRSCMHCQEDHRACDATVPSCVRCLALRRDCVYAVFVPKRTGRPRRQLDINLAGMPPMPDLGVPLEISAVAYSRLKYRDAETQTDDLPSDDESEPEPEPQPEAAEPLHATPPPVSPNSYIDWASFAAIVDPTAAII